MMVNLYIVLPLVTSNLGGIRLLVSFPSLSLHLFVIKNENFYFKSTIALTYFSQKNIKEGMFLRFFLAPAGEGALTLMDSFPTWYLR